ncbi:glycoside hydrolase family 88 protein [Opitutus sp. ER46]|uniref:glycoside hydrolase family 88/105 protein n=1 Tax=Opitutus sp. ER46 TaxID=2161864 RepID=UPI000D327B78|nr:glycoside hydrolase family 88 protein [Opitutus sp. ER46]PTX96635.1 glycoside hydrolase family 88 protein [Opitutus sp. ER46]
MLLPSRCLPLLALLPLLAGAAFATEQTDYRQRVDQPDGAVPQYVVPYEVPKPAEVRAVVDRINGYVLRQSSFRVFDQATGEEITRPDLGNLNPNAVIDGRFAAMNRWDYPNGVIISALHRMEEITGDRRYLEYPDRFYDFVFTWMPYLRAREEKTGQRHEFSKMVKMAALDHCGAITAGLIRTHLKHPDPRYAEWISVVDAYISHGQFRLPDGTLARERPQAVSLWTDDFYMGISFLAQRGRMTGDTRYWHDAVRQVTQASARLFNPQNGLYDHGWSENTDGYDPRFYWGRANGWAALAMTELLAELPKDFPNRDRVLHYYRQHLRHLVELQDGSGLWHNLLDHSETYLETSASAMFVYAIARGVNEGWLSPIYGPAALTGWNGLATRVLPDGRVDGICEGTTYANDSTYYFFRGAGPNTTFIGPVIYAGAEIIRLVQNPSLKIEAAKPGAVNSAIHFKPQAPTQ